MQNKALENSLTASDIKKSALKSVKWAALGEIASRFIRPLVILILARILTPEDFGVVGVAMIAIGLAQIFQDFGLGKTLVQCETDIDKSANVIFWTNITLALSLYLVILICAPLFSKFFHSPKVTAVLRLLCLQIVLSSFVSVHQALFQRHFQFKQLFFIRVSSAIVPGIISIPLALSGYGVWALAFGSLAGGIVRVILFWRASDWRPQLEYDFKSAKRLFGFSSWVVSEAFLGWLMISGDSIILGHFLGVKKLGVYRVGVLFTTLVFGIFLSPLMPVAYSAFSRLQSDLSQLRNLFLKSIHFVAAISLPVGFGLAALAKPISSVVFGHKWEEIGIVISILGISEAISWLVGLNSEVYRATGRPDVNTKLYLVAVIYFLPVYILAAPHGLLTFCLARCVVILISIFLHFYVANRVLRLPFNYLLGLIKVPVIGVIFMSLVVFSIGRTRIAYSWFGLIFAIAIGAICYLVSLWIANKVFVKWALQRMIEMAGYK